MGKAVLPPLREEEGGEVTQDEPPLEERTSRAAQAEDVIKESPATETKQKTVRSSSAEGEVCDPATTVAGETETPSR